MTEERDSIRAEKIEKVGQLKQLHNPYPYSYDVDSSIGAIITRFGDQLTPGEGTEHSASVAGRVLSVRLMGKIVFADLKDETGTIQLFLREDNLTDQFNLVKLIDTGDIVGAKGTIFRTKLGELSILVGSLEILNKSLTGLVDQYYGLKDIELRYRNRSLDLITNPDSFLILKQRFILTQKIREFMSSMHFLEVETPIVQPVYGGAAAVPFETHHHKLDLDMYLRVSPEQYLKRLMVGGFEAVYELGKCFRNENIDRTHNPEFTMLEAYIAYKDYNFTMDLVERLFEYLLTSLVGSTTITYEGQEINFARPWNRLTVKNALKELAGIDVDSIGDDELIAMASKTGKELNRKIRGEAILVLFEEHCEKLIIQPTHIIDYPKESTVFCKQHRDDPELIERFESYIGGREVSNGYSELNDPVLQRKLLEGEASLSEAGAEETWGQVDEEFLAAMDIGMPPASGVGIGIDRLAMIIFDQPSIRDVIFFPTMKPLK